MSRQAKPTELIAKVEKIFSEISDDLSRGRCISIPLKSKLPSTNDRSEASGDPSSIVTNVSFPGRTPQEARRFSTVLPILDKSIDDLMTLVAVLLQILDLIHQALCKNEIISKRCEAVPAASRYSLMLIDQRNIYYQNPDLFKSQAVVDRYVDIFAYTFGVQRASLNVVSTH